MRDLTKTFKEQIQIMTLANKSEKEIAKDIQEYVERLTAIRSEVVKTMALYISTLKNQRGATVEDVEDAIEILSNIEKEYFSI